MDSLVTRPTTEIDHAATGAKIRAKREAAGLSRQIVADRAGISVSYLLDLECARRNWSPLLAAKVEAALNQA